MTSPVGPVFRAKRKEAIMRALQRLDALAEPQGSQRVRLNGQVIGLVITAAALVSVVLTTRRIVLHAGLENHATLLYLVVGETLPLLLAAYGGVRLVFGDLRGKRALVYALAFGVVYALNAIFADPVPPCGDAAELCAALWFYDVIVFVVPVCAAMVLLLYAIVGSIGPRRDEAQDDGGPIVSGGARCDHRPQPPLAMPRRAHDGPR
jgi:hypothetical protein